MDYMIGRSDDAVTIAMTGQFTFMDRERFGNMIKDISGGAVTRLVLDLSSLEFIDSAGLGMFLMVRDTVGRSGAKVVIRSPKGHVRRVLDLARFDTLFTVEYTV